MTNLEFLDSLGLPTSSVNEELLWQALTHKSFAMDYAMGEVEFNERLEFLGDAILWAVIARLLYQEYPDVDESQLTLSKIFLVKESTLAQVAKNIGLWDIIKVGTGEERSGGREKASVLSDGLEALLAFVYLQYGREQVELFIHTHIYVLLWHEPVMPQKSWKNQLQELVQKHHNETPTYEDIELEVDASGDVKLFGAKVYVMDTYVCQWEGKNKKRAQENWARIAMEMLEVVDGEVKIKAN